MHVSDMYQGLQGFADKSDMRKAHSLTETYLHENAAASKALTTLKGIIEGVACDRRINDLERKKILDWIGSFGFLRKHPVVGSVFDYLSEALVDGVLTLEECSDISWMIEKNLRSFYDETTQKIQELLGLVSGIAADKEINPAELTYLSKWLNNNEPLKGLFPYDEIYSLVCQVGQKKVLSSQEKTFLVKAFSWTDDKTIAVDTPFVPWEIDPTIEFAERTFCLTGGSKRMSRSGIFDLILQRNGKVTNSVSKGLDFLVVCADVNVAWTHACYGRKVEQAIKLRRHGAKLALISERDFWDALAE